VPYAARRFLDVRFDCTGRAAKVRPRARITRIADWPQSVFASPSVFLRGLGGIFIGADIGSRRFWARLLPKSLGDLQRIDFEILPPGNFIAGLMQLPMMATAEGNGELVADFKTQGSRLGKPQVVRVARLPAADQAGL
jgi:hypothetical protein